MTAAEIISQLESLGSEAYRRIMTNHGVKEPLLGVKIEELKKIQKVVKKDYQLARELYDTGIYDAQYLAGLIADAAKMTEDDLRHWLAVGNCGAICGTAVAWVAAEGPHGMKLAREWIESDDENTAQTGWNTLTSILAVTPDSQLDHAEVNGLLDRVGKTIHQQPNRVRYSMNSFVTAVGIYVAELTQPAIEAGERIGKVSVDMGNTACEVPYSPDYIRKAEGRGRIGKKRKSARC